MTSNYKDNIIDLYDSQYITRDGRTARTYYDLNNLVAKTGEKIVAIVNKSGC